MLIKIYAELIKQLFSVIFEFVRKFTNSSYSIGLYLNMNRIIKAEADMNEAIRAMRILIKQMAFLKFQNLGSAMIYGQHWLGKARQSIKYRNKSKEMGRY